MTTKMKNERKFPPLDNIPWKIPWMEEPGGLQSMGSLRAGHDWETSLSLFTFMHWRMKWKPTPVFLLENPRDGGAWWAVIYGVAQNRTQLKRLNSSSCSSRQYSIKKHRLKLGGSGTKIGIKISMNRNEWYETTRKKQTLYKLLCYTVRLALKLMKLIQPNKWCKSIFIGIRIALQYIKWISASFIIK